MTAVSARSARAPAAPRQRLEAAQRARPAAWRPAPARGAKRPQASARASSADAEHAAAADDQQHLGARLRARGADEAAPRKAWVSDSIGRTVRKRRLRATARPDGTG